MTYDFRSLTATSSRTRFDCELKGAGGQGFEPSARARRRSQVREAHFRFSRRLASVSR